MSEYKLVMHLWNDDVVGHMAAELVGPDGKRDMYAFGPKGSVEVSKAGGNTKVSTGDLKRFYGPGVGRGKADKNKINLALDGKKPITNTSAPISLTREQYEGFNVYGEKKQKNPDTYFSLGNNCVDFVKEGLGTVGKKVDDLPAKFSPKALREGGAAAHYLIEKTGNEPLGKFSVPAGSPAGLLAKSGMDLVKREALLGAKYYTDTGREFFEKAPDQSRRSVTVPLPKQIVDDLQKNVPSKSLAAPTGKAPDLKPTPLPDATTGPHDKADTQETSFLPTQKADAATKKMLDTFLKPGDAADEALLKPVTARTEDENSDIMKKRIGQPTGSPEHKKLAKAETDFFKANYGDAPTKRDATGRMIDIEPVGAVPKKLTPIRTPEGQPLDGALGDVAGRVGKRAATQGTGDAVKGLQTGLNVGGARLKVDGINGPKTAQATRQATATLGAPKVKAMDALGDFTNRASGGAFKVKPDTLAQSVGGVAKTVKPPLPLQSAANTFQKTINKTGSTMLGSTFAPIKQDGLIGPKTTTAFADVFKASGPLGFAKSWGQGFGLFS